MTAAEQSVYMWWSGFTVAVTSSSLAAVGPLIPQGVVNQFQVDGLLPMASKQCYASSQNLVQERWATLEPCGKSPLSLATWRL